MSLKKEEKGLIADHLNRRVIILQLYWLKKWPINLRGNEKSHKNKSLTFMANQFLNSRASLMPN